MKTLLQLFSARDFQPWQSVLEKTAAAGYDGIEPFAAVFDDPENFRKMAAGFGLTLPSAHVPLDLLENDPEKVFTVAKTFGMELIVVPWMPEEARPKSSSEANALARRLSELSRRVEQAGFTLAYHNHDFEFARLEDGSQLMDIILTADPGIAWEPDIGWLIRAGEAPLTWLNRFADRIVAVHLKDYVGGDSEGGWADLGFGPTDYAPIFAKLATLPKLRYCIAEHDDPSDFGRFVRRWMESYAKLAKTAGISA